MRLHRTVPTCLIERVLSLLEMNFTILKNSMVPVSVPIYLAKDSQSTKIITNVG
jgi:hypothetical protein